MVGASRRDESRPSSREVLVDPGIAAIIKTAGAPAGVPKAVLAPTVPGKTGMWAGIRMILGSLRHGTEFQRDMRDRYGDIYRMPFAGTPVIAVWDVDEIQKIFKN